MTYHWPPDMAAPIETWMDLSIDQSKQSSTGGHSRGPSLFPFLSLSPGISSPRTCQIQAGFQTPYFTARYLVQQPVTGCHSPKPTVPLPREFHAILLQGVTGNPATGTSKYPPLVVDVLVKGTGDSMRSVVLWLVSEANVSWKIRTQGILGQLEVKVTNHHCKSALIVF